MNDNMEIVNLILLLVEQMKIHIVYVEMSKTNKSSYSYVQFKLSPWKAFHFTVSQVLAGDWYQSTIALLLYKAEVLY